MKTNLGNIQSLINQQREAFFKAKIGEINKVTPLNKGEIEDLRLALLAAEHPESEESQQLVWSQERDSTGLQPICDETMGVLMMLEILWPRVWRKYQLRHREVLSARFVLTIEKNKGCQFAKAKSSEPILIEELHYEFKKAEYSLTPPDNIDELEKIPINKKGLYELDQKLLKYATRMIGSSREGSKIVENNIKILYEKDNSKEARIKNWEFPLFWQRNLAIAVWFNLIKDRVEAFYKKPAALPVVIHDNIHSMMKKGVSYEKNTGKILDKNGQEIAKINENELKPLPFVDMRLMQKIINPKNIKVLNSVNAYRLFRWEITTSTYQAVTDKIDARHISVDGGYDKLAYLIGAGHGRKAANQVRDILMWQAAPQQHVFIDPETGKKNVIQEGNMLTFSYKPGGFKQRASLNIIIGTMLMPHYVYKLINSQELDFSNEALKLIPLMPEPYLIGRPADQGPQLIFHSETIIEFRKGAKELARNGCLRITENRFKHLAQRAGLSDKLYPKVIDAWIQGGGETPPCLVRVEKDHYRFAENGTRQHDFIVEGGKKELAASKAGKQSAAKKNAGIFKMSKKI